ncbi:LysR family transcriptional regulator [Sphingomonas immobilis]|uniref:LysR family transcriptional regulator n=1 Tax=Sphingomonas immobilis TaxID=3063997 RepID=A0ABT8ZTB4_9SPHN|nr:LysR family transcriptional regulator [Sphingomonas sp. CA1-15]MDO7840805.1 LysR family transcriptional regulator [Sphingomonas sp. CA1-15]
MTNDVDLNLLVALDALLDEGSVTRAARRLGLSASAMSRTLARLRAATGDPLLVRAGRELAATPRALELRDRVHHLARDARAVLRPVVRALDLTTLDRTFVVRANEGFVDLFAAHLTAAMIREAPRICLHFVPKPNADPLPLREGHIDLDIGLLGHSGPEVRTTTLFHDRFVGAVREGHPLLSGTVTAERYAAFDHVVSSRTNSFRGPVDDALGKRQLRRTIRVVVPGFPDAMRVAQQSDLVALITKACLGNAPTGMPAAAAGLVGFDLPVETPDITVCAMWHPRVDADPAHRWLRETFASVCRRAYL